MKPPVLGEFSRPERVDQIGAREKAVDIAADPGERAALARRFGLFSIERLEASFALRAEAGGVAATGTVRGEVTQACSATGEPVPARIDEAVELRFVQDLNAVDDEVELSADALDVLAIEGGVIDLGEAAAETLALALDPFPRHPDAAAKLAEAGVVAEGEEEVGPFAALADLKKKLGG